MKNPKLFVAILAICSFLFYPSLVNGSPAYKEGGAIILNTKKGNHPTQPRMPAYNPFYAELTELGVLLVSDSDWGDATVTLSSLEGDYYQTIFDMADGSILLPVSGDSGDSYTLSIIIGGLEYEGSFVL